MAKHVSNASPWYKHNASTYRAIGMTGKVLLTSEVVSVAEEGAVGGEKWLIIGGMSFGGVLHAHQVLMDIWQRFDMATGSEAHGGKLSPAIGGKRW
jgi:hypothetical protein